MKTGKNMIAIVLCVAMLAALTACNGAQAEGIVGKWEASLDMKEMMEQNMDGMTLDAFTIVMRFQFNQDGTYVVEMDQNSVKQAMNGLKAPMEKLFEEQAKELGMSLDEFKKAYEESMGVSFDAMFDSLINELLDSEEFAFKNEGCYKEADGKLYFSDDKSEPADEDDDYVTYELKGSELRLTGVPEGDSYMFADAMFPMVFKRK